LKRRKEEKKKKKKIGSSGEDLGLGFFFLSFLGK